MDAGRFVQLILAIGDDGKQLPLAGVAALALLLAAVDERKGYIPHPRKHSAAKTCVRSSTAPPKSSREIWPT
jgi:hypothetical protein